MKKFLISACLAISALAASALDQLTNIPTLYVTTEGGAAITSKEDYVTCSVTIVTDIEEDAITDKTGGIRGRGNSTWGMPKKPYRIKFDKKINLFNRPAKAKSWVLLANYADKTLMRNALAFEISRYIDMAFSPSAVFVDLVLNGQYQGNYMVSDQMQVGQGRVDIDEMEATDIEGDALTGGYFLEIDGFADSELVWFQSNKGLKFTVKSPDEDVIQPVQLNYIKTFIQTFENKLFASNFTDPEQGYRSMVDEESLINWYIACELTGNSDSFWSTYVYKPRNDEHLYFGPLWDFDIAFNNDNRLGDAVNKLMRDHAHNPKDWIQRLWQDQWFRTAVYKRWRQLMNSGMEQYLLNFIDQTATYLDASQKRNFQKWNILNVRVYNEQFLFPTYKGGVDYLKTYVSQRIAFLTNSFRNSGEVSEIDNIKENNPYYIIQYNGLYATPESDNFYIENPDLARQEFTFVKAGDGIWNLRTYDGRYVASKGSTGDKYCTFTTDGTNINAQFKVEASQHAGYAKIKNLGTNLYLGIENQAHWSRISTNKDGTSTNHAWKIINVSANTSALEEAISEAQDLLQSATVGTEAGQYPKSAYDALAEAIAIARGYLNSNDQEEIDEAVAALKQAIADFRASKVFPADAIVVDSDTFISQTDMLQGNYFNITSPQAMLVFENMKPLDVIALADHIAVDGAAADIDANCRISIYRHGTALLAHSPEFEALTAYSGAGLTGESMACAPEYYYSNNPSSFVKAENKRAMTLKDNVKSFVLRRGYMATLAQEENGMGYSQVFIADKEDLQVDLPAEFEGKVGFIRVFPWQWTSKKGWVGGNSSLTNPEGFIEDQCEVTNSTWLYTWGPNADWARNPEVRGTAWRNQEFVPQKWGYGGDGDWTTIYNQRGSNHLLGYNEPDHSEQSNVSVDKAIEEWPILLQTGMRLGTPSVTDFWWLYEFMDKAKAKGYRVDFAAIHSYWGGSGGAVVVNGIDDWMKKLTEIHERTGLPIWITEWNNGANWTHEGWPSTEEEQYEKQRQFIEEILPAFDAEPWMERYSIYNWVQSKRSMFHGNLNLTPAGQVYADFKADFAYQTPDEQEPDEPEDPNGLASAAEGAFAYDAASLTLTAPSAADIKIYSVDGRIALSAKAATRLSVAALQPGCYIAVSNGTALKFIR